MNRLQRAALLTALADQLHQRGSWCGETHLQKAAYFLQELLGVPLGFSFILYKHGPFSFDLSDELTALQADRLLEMRARPVPYGPSLLPSAASESFRERYAVTLQRHDRQLEFVSRTFSSKGVADLERLATAFYVRRESPTVLTTTQRAERLHELKPHVAPDQAHAAVQETDRIIEEASSAKFE